MKTKTPRLKIARKSLVLLTLLLFPLILMASVWTVESVPNPRASDVRLHTVDPENLLDDASQAQIDQLLTTLEQQTTAEVMVVVLKSVGETFIKDFATQLFNYWKIGNAQKDNGLIILMVEDQYKVSFETGYGLEGVLPDAICMRIIQNVITPQMRNGQYGAGLLGGVQAVAELLNNPAAVAEIKADMVAEEAAAREASLLKVRNFIIGYVLVSFLVLILCLMNVRKKRSAIQTVRVPDKTTPAKRTVAVAASAIEPYDTYKTLVSAKSGYTVLTLLFPLTMVGFLIWYNLKLRQLRRMPRACAHCEQPMNLLSEKQEDAYLTAGQQSEEMVGSVDYDAWICPTCGKRDFFSYSKAFTRYKPCPVCGYKTYAQTGERIVSTPTPISAGEGERVYRCANCNHELRKRYVIPMIIVIAGVGGGRGGSGGGGFGGGSFGGGMSGGGGATGGWN